MSRPPLPSLSYVLMALIGEGGASPHEIVDMVRRGGPIFWTAAPSKIYALPKRLEEEGYLCSHKAPGKTRERTVYQLTDAGRAALRAWLAAPAPFPRIQHEAHVRLLAGDMLEDEEIVRSLQGLRRESEAIGELVGEMEAAMPRFPHRERYLRLSNSLARRLLRAHLDWVDEVERELGAGATRADTASKAADEHTPAKAEA